MRVAFEISPLLNASGTFGDKSGVYRYTYGLIESLEDIIKKSNKKDVIVLFTFNKTLLNFPLNPEVLRLVKNKNVYFLNNYKEFCGEPRMGSSIQNLALQIPIFRFFLRVFNKLFNLKKFYNRSREHIHFRLYIKYLKKEFLKHKITVIIHSETGFYHIEGYKNALIIYDLTPILLDHFHRSETISLFTRKMFFSKKYVDLLICISQSTKDDLLKYYPSFKNKKIIVSPPGYCQYLDNGKKEYANTFKEISLFLKDKKKELVSKEYLMYYGTFEPRKNIIYLVKAFAELLENNQIPSDFKLLLVGGKGWGNIKKQITDYLKENFELSGKHKIILFDYLSDKYLFSLIKNAYAVVYPSLYEGFGLPILESMKIGTPVICSNKSSMPEVGGDAVLYLNPYDYYDLKNKMKDILNNPKQAKKMSSKGLIQSQKFSWDKTARQLYQSLND